MGYGASTGLPLQFRPFTAVLVKCLASCFQGVPEIAADETRAEKARKESPWGMNINLTPELEEMIMPRFRGLSSGPVTARGD
jgi:hypothetical protein